MAKTKDKNILLSDVFMYIKRYQNTYKLHAGRTLNILYRHFLNMSVNGTDSQKDLKEVEKKLLSRLDSLL